MVARLAAKRAVSVILAGACVVVDRAIRWHEMGFALRAVIDEPCHAATAVVVLGAITRFRSSPPDPVFIGSMLASSVLIDLDHLPLEFGSSAVTAGTPRPYTHALWVVAVLIAATFATRRLPRKSLLLPLLAGSAWGISAHFLRDVATAPMSLWWPISDAAVQVPYWWYVLALGVMIAIQASSRSLSDPPRAGQDPCLFAVDACATSRHRPSQSPIASERPHNGNAAQVTRLLPSITHCSDKAESWMFTPGDLQSWYSHGAND